MSRPSRRPWIRDRAQAIWFYLLREVLGPTPGMRPSPMHVRKLADELEFRYLPALRRVCDAMPALKERDLGKMMSRDDWNEVANELGGPILGIIDGGKVEE